MRMEPRKPEPGEWCGCGVWVFQRVCLHLVVQILCPTGAVSANKNANDWSRLMCVKLFVCCGDRGSVTEFLDASRMNHIL